jgi:hypothetical protein
MPNTFIQPPVRKPRKGGIKSVTGEFISNPRLGVGGNIEWVSEGCNLPVPAPGLCYATTPVTGDKDFDGIDQGSGPVFGLYVGVQCFLGPNEDYDRRATSLLDQGEDRGVEEVLWEWATTKAGAPLVAVNVVQGIAEAEEAADTLYIGQPVLVMARETAVRAAALNALDFDREGNLWTPNGTPVISTSAASGNTIVVIGWPTVYASTAVVTQVMDHTINQEMALAERVYALAVDCEFAVAYTVPPPAADPVGTPEEPLELLLGSIPSSPIPDGTDTTITVQTNVAPDDEVFLHYSINGGPDVTAGEMTQVNPQEFVWNVIGDSTTTGDSVEVWAVSGTTESNHITIEVT